MNAWPPSLLLNWNLRSFCLVKCVTYWYLVSHVTSENLIEFTIWSVRPHASFYETDVFETYFLNRVPFKFLFQMPHQTSFARIVFICLLTSWKITWLLHTFQMCVCAWWLKKIKLLFDSNPIRVVVPCAWRIDLPDFEKISRKWDFS